MTREDCLAGRYDPRHLFTCPECRIDVRLAHAWRDLREDEPAESAVDLDFRFVDRVLQSARGDRADRLRRRWALAAAAALLFFFFAGTGLENASAASGAPEASYATMLTPNALDGLIPN